MQKKILRPSLFIWNLSATALQFITIQSLKLYLFNTSEAIKKLFKLTRTILETFDIDFIDRDTHVTYITCTHKAHYVYIPFVDENMPVIKEYAPAGFMIYPKALLRSSKIRSVCFFL